MGHRTVEPPPSRKVPTSPSFPCESITPNPRQPRTVFDEDALSELVDSIAEVGLLQPIVVRPLGNDRYELVMGERRWRAAGLAGLDAIPAIVRRTEDHELLRDALLENLHRAQLNPLEEAAAYQQMLEDFGCTQDELSTRIKRSRPQISNTIRLLKLPPSVQRRVAAGVLSAGHARALLGLARSGGAGAVGATDRRRGPVRPRGRGDRLARGAWSARCRPRHRSARSSEPEGRRAGGRDV